MKKSPAELAEEKWQELNFMVMKKNREAEKLKIEKELKLKEEWKLKA